MVKNNSGFIVPESDRKDFDLMIQRANRRIKASLKFIQQEDIKSDSAKRALVGDYATTSTWHTQKTPFSRSKVFSSKKAYEQFKRHVMQWGDVKNNRSVESVKEGYYKAIIKSLTTLAMESGASVLYKNGRLPVEVTRAVKSMTLEQMSHYFDEGDAGADLDYLYYKWEDYAGVADRDDFKTVALSHINTVKQVYLAKEVTPKKVKKKKTKRSKKAKKSGKNRRKKR